MRRTHPNLQISQGSCAGDSRVQLAMGVAREEGRIKSGSLDFYRTALPAGPILVLGFICLEGKEVSAFGAWQCKCRLSPISQPPIPAYSQLSRNVVY